MAIADRALPLWLSALSRVLWWSVPPLTALLVCLPILALFASWITIDQTIWSHLLHTQMLRLISNTLVLVLGVAFCTSLIGISLAWLVALCEFPGRKWLDWALMLPLAVPPYVYAFVLLGVFDFGGPVQHLLGMLPGDYRPVDIRSTPVLILVLSAVLYPYVYLLTRGSLMAQGRAALDTAQSLGATPWRCFFRVGLPMARPGLVAGLSLALMETLADFGAVSVFNYDTFTTAIYKSWISLFSIATASQLATLLMLFVFSVILLERGTRGRGKLGQSSKRFERYQLSKWQGWIAFSWCFLVLFAAFFLPVMQLLSWAWIQLDAQAIRQVVAAISNTFLLGLMAACLIVSLCLLCSLSIRIRGRGGIYSDIASLGYAVPGSVLAVGFIVIATSFDRVFASNESLLVGSLLGLLLAYVVRFYRPAISPIDSSMAQLRPQIAENAQLLGASRARIVRKIYLPILAPGVFAAMLLAMVDVMKEMPATLMLRPFGWDTLATRIYGLTSEGEWERAALPALVLVMVSCVPVVILTLQSRKRRE